MNVVVIQGRLTSDINLRTTTNNISSVSFVLAVPKLLSKDKRKRYEDEGLPTADFIPCRAFGKLAEAIAKNVGKGNRVTVSGAIQSRNYMSNDGSRRQEISIIASSVDFIDYLSDGHSADKKDSTTTDDANYRGDGLETIDMDDIIPF